MGTHLDLDDVAADHPKARDELARLREENARLQLQGHSLFGKGQDALAEEMSRLREEVERLREDAKGSTLVRCHSGHESPRALWNCPVCTDLAAARLSRADALERVEDALERIAQHGIELRASHVDNYSGFNPEPGKCVARLHLAADNPITPGIAFTLILAPGVVDGIENACEGTPPPPGGDETPRVR